MKEENDDQMRECILKSHSTYPDDPSKITITHVMAVEFPDVIYELMRAPFIINTFLMRAKYNNTKEIERVIMEKIPWIYNVIVTEVSP